MCDKIREICDDLMDEGDCSERPEIIEEAKGVLNSDLMTDNFESERNKAINELVELSRYCECYNIPTQFNGDSSVYDNLIRFYSDIIKMINVKL